jgi:hypothetical protein
MYNVHTLILCMNNWNYFDNSNSMRAFLAKTQQSLIVEKNNRTPSSLIITPIWSLCISPSQAPTSVPAKRSAMNEWRDEHSLQRVMIDRSAPEWGGLIAQPLQASIHKSSSHTLALTKNPLPTRTVLTRVRFYPSLISMEGCDRAHALSS